jgi:toxin FitB
MAFLLDTCTISEMVAVQPNLNVLSWFETQNEKNFYLSIITVGEIEKGIFQLPVSKKRTSLETWFFGGFVSGFQGRILNIDLKSMTTWAKMIADLKSKGVLRPAFDSLIEATALEHDLILVTRNVKNFGQSQVTILNPWED